MSANAKLGRSQRIGVAATLVAVVVIATAVSGWRRKEAQPVKVAKPAAQTEMVQCSFDVGETAAFSVDSTVRDVRSDEEDHLRAIMSWQVVEKLSGSRWRLQAALSDVSHSQSLTLPEERVKGSLTDPFFVEVDASCRFVGFGFAREWDARRRQLVQTMLKTHEFVLPATGDAKRWSVSQSDGMGAFEARYARAPGAQPASGLRIQRRKAAYEGKAQAETMGLSLVVVASEATASFDGSQPDWVTTSSGHERVQVRVQGQVQADLLQRFRLVRDDARFVAMQAMASSDADFRDAFALEVDRKPGVDAELTQRTYEEALKGFLAHFGGSGDASYAAARDLAAWLKAHPEGAKRLVAALKAGTIDEVARPALFLGLELSGTPAAREALSSVLTDRGFRGVDRARAASALSDIGEPTKETAELLLAQAKNDRDDMVANVSLLGLGSMARRSGEDDEVKAYVHASLDKELATADDDAQTHFVLDAMGNSGDATFADDLETNLGAESASTRQHAAEALGRLDPNEAGPRLLARLHEEKDPTVRTAIVGAMRGAPTAEAVTLMAATLAASTSVPERAAIITWLGTASRTQPEARSHLVAHFHRETSARLLQLIGSFVPAAVLR